MLLWEETENFELRPKTEEAKLGDSHFYGGICGLAVRLRAQHLVQITQQTLRLYPDGLPDIRRSVHGRAFRASRRWWLE